MVLRKRLRRVQHHVPVGAGRARRFCRPGRAGIAAPRAVPPRIRGPDPAREPRAAAAGKPVLSAAGEASLTHSVQGSTPMKRQLHLNLFFHSRGHHEASWRHPAASPLALTDIRYYQDLAQRAEAALFDSIFLADQLALGGDVAQAPRIWLEPLTVLAALSVSTSRIGLIAPASTTYTEPFNLARQFASIDHISNGRAAWNIVTSWLATAASNYGGDKQVSHADRYARGEEFMSVVKALWDSWAEDAVIDDRDGGHYARPDRTRPVNHRGDFYQVAGPLNMPRCPQGRPVLVQAGSSDTGRRFAARHAEAVFTAHMAKETAQEFYADLKRLAVAG